MSMSVMCMSMLFCPSVLNTQKKSCLTSSFKMQSTKRLFPINKHVVDVSLSLRIHSLDFSVFFLVCYLLRGRQVTSNLITFPFVRVSSSIHFPLQRRSLLSSFAHHLIFSINDFGLSWKVFLKAEVTDNSVTKLLIHAFKRMSQYYERSFTMGTQVHFAKVLVAVTKSDWKGTQVHFAEILVAVTKYDWKYWRKSLSVTTLQFQRLLLLL